MVARDCGHNLIGETRTGGQGRGGNLRRRRHPRGCGQTRAGDHLSLRAGLLRRHPLAGAKIDLRRFRQDRRRALKAVQIGHPLGQATQMGPVVSDIQRKRVLGYLEHGRRCETVLGLAPRRSRAAKAATTSSRPCSPARWITSLRARKFWPGGLPRPVRRRARHPPGQQHRLRPGQQCLVQRPRALQTRGVPVRGRQRLDQLTQRSCPRGSICWCEKKRHGWRGCKPRNTPRLLSKYFRHPPNMAVRNLCVSRSGSRDR